MQEYLINNKSVKMIDLRKSGDYPQHLLDMLMNRDYSELAKYPSDTRSNPDYMNALLYAIKNELGTYEIYKYFTESLQNDVELTSEIIKTEPHLLAGTPLSDDPQFIKENINETPEIAYYMSTPLKSDPKFVSELCANGNLSVRAQVVVSCTPNLILNNLPEMALQRDLIQLVAREDPFKAFEIAGNELKNDSNFMKTLASENEKVIDAVISNMASFGNEGLKGVQESSRKYSMDDCSNAIDTLAETSEDKRYAKVQSTLKEKGSDDPAAMRWVSAMLAQNENVDPLSVSRILNYSILTMEQAKRSLSESADQTISLESMQKLITPKILHRLCDNLERQGKPVSPEVLARLDDYDAFFNDYHAKFNEQKRKKREIELLGQREGKTEQSEPENHEADTTVPKQTEHRDLLSETIDLSTTYKEVEQASNSIQTTLEQDRDSDISSPSLEGEKEADSPDLEQ